jgi:protein-tyrosine-phosphatase
MADVPEVRFACPHNAGRSQMAAALPTAGKVQAADVATTMGRSDAPH